MDKSRTKTLGNSDTHVLFWLQMSFTPCMRCALPADVESTMFPSWQGFVERLSSIPNRDISPREPCSDPGYF